MKKTAFLFIALSSALSAAPFTGSVGMNGSSVDVEVVENSLGVLGSETGVNISSGSIEVSLSDTLDELTLTGGSFVVADTSIDLVDPAGFLNSSGLGFSVENSVFTLTPDSGNTYFVNGDLNLVADQGAADVDFPAYDRDFESNPSSFTASLLSTSTATLTSSGPGTYAFSAALKFSATSVDTFSDSGFTVSVNVASENTLNLGGSLTAVPEPATALLWGAGLLGLWACRRFRNESTRGRME